MNERHVDVEMSVLVQEVLDVVRREVEIHPRARGIDGLIRRIEEIKDLIRKKIV
jgi:hypothetical protein